MQKTYKYDDGKNNPKSNTNNKESRAEEIENILPDWKMKLRQFQAELKQIEELTKEDEPEEDSKKKSIGCDLLDLRKSYRKIKVKEQCSKLSVPLPKRLYSWRDKIFTEEKDTHENTGLSGNKKNKIKVISHMD